MTKVMRFDRDSKPLHGNSISAGTGGSFCRLRRADHAGGASNGQIPTSFAIEDVTVVDIATASTHPHQTVVIEGDHIIAIHSPSAIPKSARVIRGTGKFLMPGLWDMRVHLTPDRASGRNPLPEYLAAGVTGVQDVGSDFTRVSAWRDAVKNGTAPGPEVLTSGPAVSGDEASEDGSPVIVARNPFEARKAFDRLWDLNVDLISVTAALSPDSYFAIAEQARHWDLRVVGDLPGSISALNAFESRQQTLDHLSGLLTAVSTDQDALAFFDRCALMGVRMLPGLGHWSRMAEDGDEKIKGQIERIDHLVSLMSQSKVEILAGSDAGEAGAEPGTSLHDELERLVAAGLDPHQALAAATLAPVRMIGWGESYGSIEPGKSADLLLLDANPLIDVKNTRKIAGVFARGRYYSRKELDARTAGR